MTIRNPKRRGLGRLLIGCAANLVVHGGEQIKLDQVINRLLLPKSGWLRYRNSLDVLGELRNVTVMREPPQR